MEIVPNLGVDTQEKEYILDIVPALGWNIALAQPTIWDNFIQDKYLIDVLLILVHWNIMLN